MTSKGDAVARLALDKLLRKAERAWSQKAEREHAHATRDLRQRVPLGRRERHVSAITILHLRRHRHGGLTQTRARALLGNRNF